MESASNNQQKNIMIYFTFLFSQINGYFFFK